MKHFLTYKLNLEKLHQVTGGRKGKNFETKKSSNPITKEDSYASLNWGFTEIRPMDSDDEKLVEFGGKDSLSGKKSHK